MLKVIVSHLASLHPFQTPKKGVAPTETLTELSSFSWILVNIIQTYFTSSLTSKYTEFLHHPRMNPNVHIHFLRLLVPANSASKTPSLNKAGYKKHKGGLLIYI